MRNTGRLLAVGAICAGVLGMASAPASALTVAIGGAAPAIPIPIIPLPGTASATVGGDAPVQVDVHAPASTEVSVTAGPSGVHAKATVGGPLAEVGVGTPNGAPVPVPVGGSDPVGAIPTPGNPVPGEVPAASPSSVSPADPLPDASSAANAHASATARGIGTAAPMTARDIGATRQVGDHGTGVTASIASSPRTGLLTALPDVGSRLVLWIALAGAVIALRLFVGSATTRASRAR